MPHVFMPELGLMITNLHFFTKNCQYQPYVAVFRTEGMKQKDIDEQMDKKWESSSKDNVVMRTASFGHDGPVDMQVCAKREDNVGAGGTVTKGLGDDAIVPMGLLAALGRQMIGEGKYRGGCGLG